MVEGAYKLIYCEASTGVVLNHDGSWWRNDSGIKQYQPTLESLNEARKQKDILLGQNPKGEVSILLNNELLEVHRETAN